MGNYNGIEDIEDDYDNPIEWELAHQSIGKMDYVLFFIFSLLERQQENKVEPSEKKPEKIYSIKRALTTR